MTTVKELIAYLQTVDQNAEVKVLVEDSSGYSVYTHYIDLRLPDAYGYAEGMDNLGDVIHFGEK